MSQPLGKKSAEWSTADVTGPGAWRTHRAALPAKEIPAKTSEIVVGPCAAGGGLVLLRRSTWQCERKQPAARNPSGSYVVRRAVAPVPAGRRAVWVWVWVWVRVVVVASGGDG
jgi:hypothetical protein